MTTGTIISIVLGVAGIIATYLFTKLQMKKNKIDHYFVNSYDIGKGLTDDFPEFQLHYGDEVLSKNVKVFKGGFVNSGRKDIGETSKQSEIQIVLPEGYLVKAVKVISLAEGLIVEHVNCENEKKDDDRNNIIVFGIKGLFRPKEYFDYSIIVEVPEDMVDLDSEIKFQHRIKDTEDIRNIKIEQELLSLHKTNMVFLFCSGVVFSLFLFELKRLFIDGVDVKWQDYLVLLVVFYFCVCVIISIYEGKKIEYMIKELKKYHNINLTTPL